MTGDELIPVEYNGKNYNINTRDIFNNVSDYNLSVLFPNDGINGDNKYDLEQACKILKPYFDNQNAKHGFIISFYNSDNIIEKWLFCKDNKRIFSYLILYVNIIFFIIKNMLLLEIVLQKQYLKLLPMTMD